RSSRSTPAGSAAMPPSCCARSRRPSTSPPTRTRCARPSGRKARRPSHLRSTWSARSDHPLIIAPSPGRHRPPGHPGPAGCLHQRPAPLPVSPGSPPTPAPSPPAQAAPASALPSSSPPPFLQSGAIDMLDDNLKTQLKAYLEKLTQPIELVASLDDSEKSRELDGLLRDIDALSERITLRHDGEDARRPSFAINRPGTDISVAFAGIPMGHEFTSLVLALLQVGGHPAKITEELA